MLLKHYMEQTGIKPDEMASRIVESAGPDTALTGEAVRLWAAGRRMPKTEWIEAIRVATKGRVTAEDHHLACVEYQRSEGIDMPEFMPVIHGEGAA